MVIKAGRKACNSLSTRQQIGAFYSAANRIPATGKQARNRSNSTLKLEVELPRSELVPVFAEYVHLFFENLSHTIALIRANLIAKFYVFVMELCSLQSVVLSNPPAVTVHRTCFCGVRTSANSK